jgi:hypothetical protein
MFNTLAIVALIPMYDRGLLPVLRRLHCPMTLLRRIGEHLVCTSARSILSVLPMLPALPALLGLAWSGEGSAP